MIFAICKGQGDFETDVCASLSMVVPFSQGKGFMF